LDLFKAQFSGVVHGWGTQDDHSAMNDQPVIDGFTIRKIYVLTRAALSSNYSGGYGG